MEHPEIVLDELVQVVKPTGGIGVVGVYIPEDPGANGDLAKEGKLALDFGTFFLKGRSMGTGQCNTKQYNAGLRDLITEGKATPGFLVSHELLLSEAPKGYDHFDKREEGLDQGSPARESSSGGSCGDRPPQEHPHRPAPFPVAGSAGGDRTPPELRVS